jgi:transposase
MVSKELRQLISAGRKAGIEVEVMAQTFQVGRSTIYNLLAQEDKSGNMNPHTDRCGRPSAVDEAGMKRMQQLIEERPDITLEEIKKEMGLKISISAIWRKVHDKLGFNYKKKRFTPASGIPKKTR